MARKEQKIKVVSYCYVGDELVCTDDLNEEQKERLAVAINWGLLASRYGAGNVTPPPGFDVCRDQHGRIKVTRVPVTA